MKLEWIGKYRDMVEKLIRYCNEYSQIYTKESYIGTDIKISYAQIQVVEYLLENEDLHQNMSQIANRLGISLSTFSKIANRLTNMGLLVKYHTDNNKKNIIIQVSELGRKIYRQYSEHIYNTHFSKMFAVADKIPDDIIPLIAEMLDAGLLPTIGESPDFEPTLIPINKPDTKS